MYLDFFKLQREPFHITPDPTFFCLFPSHREALGALLYGVERRKGFIAVTGEIGVGKTTILRAFLERIDREHTKIIYLLNANVPFEDLLRTLLQEFGYAQEADGTSAMVNQLHWALVEHLSKDRNVVLVIDEAQNMPAETMEGLRILSNLETVTDKLLQIVFCGQPELDTKLARPELRQLKQRIAVRVKVLPLTRAESVRYIQHRLAIAGVPPDTSVFTKRAIRQIVSAARGMPRVINILCDNALATALGYQERRVTRRVAKEIIRDFRAESRFKAPQWWLATAISTSTMAVAVSAGFLFLDDPGRVGHARSVPQSIAQPQGGVQVQPNRESYPELLQRLPAAKPAVAAHEMPADAENRGPQKVVAQFYETGASVQSSTSGEKDRGGGIREMLPRLTTEALANVVPMDDAMDAKSREAERVVAQATEETVPALSSSGKHGAINTKLSDLATYAQKSPKSVFNDTNAVSVHKIAVHHLPASEQSPQEAVTRVVSTGDRLIDLVAEIYGTSDQRLVQFVRQHNPQIKNANVIHVGERILFPYFDHFNQSQ